MTHHTFRTVMRSTVGAAILIPALALAQSNGPTPHQGSQGSTSGSTTGSQGSASQGSGSQGTQGTGTQGTHGTGTQGTHGTGTQSSSSSGATTGSSGGSATQGGMMGSQQSGMQSGTSSTGSTARIDPAEVQRVFGSDVQIVDLQSLGPDQIRSMQQALKDRGHYNGEVDGVWGPQTRAGLNAMLSQQYSMNQRLIRQGQVTGPLAMSLGIQKSEIAPVGGTEMRSGQQIPNMNRSQPMTGQGNSQRSGSSNTGSSHSGSSNTGSSNTGSPSGSSSSGTHGTSGTGTSGSGTSGSGTSSGSGTTTP
jgi:hypothetical protein